MAEITKAGMPSPCSTNPSSDQFPDYTAGEDIGAGDQCYVAVDGMAYRAGGAAAAGLQLRVRGQAAKNAYAGESVTLTRGLRFYYGSGLSKGSDVFLSGATLGGIATVTVAGAAAVGFCVDDVRVEFFYSH